MDYQRKLLKCAFNTLLGSLVVVMLLVLPGRAGATDYTFNYFAQPVPTTLYWGPLALSHGPNEIFVDTIKFSTSDPFTAQFIDNFTTLSNFGYLDARLWTDTGNPFTDVLVYSGAFNTPTAPFAWSNPSPSSALAAGNYQVVMGGFMNASITPNPTAESGGIILAAIPEPETYAMMLAGLGLMGFVARRRRQAVAA